jgi:DNA-binding XRE family transcriptional regulator
VTPAEVIATRKALGWSQHDLAKKGGLSRTLVSRFELGHATTEETRTRITVTLDGKEVPAPAWPVPSGPPVELPEDVCITPAQARAARRMAHKVPVTVCRAIAIAPATLQKAENVKKGPIAPLLARKLRAYYEAAGSYSRRVNRG